MEIEESIGDYLAHLDDLAGAIGAVFQIEGNPSPIGVIAYDDTPEQGSILGFTYGVSAVSKPEWRFGRPELCICMDSNDRDWVLALGHVAAMYREKSLFSYGDVLTLDSTIVEDSGLDAFLLFAPQVLEADQARVVLTSRTLNLVQAYPIFRAEIDVIGSLGIERFLIDSSLDFFDPHRLPLVIN